jgi:hypothetical protein
MYFEVYDTDLNTTPIADFTVVAGDVTETNTGWSYAGRIVFLGEFPFPSPVALANGTTYWTAFSMDSTDGAFAITANWGSPNWSSCQQNFQGGGWGIPDGAEPCDISMRMDGGTSGIESASLGTLKASFK